MTLPSLRLSWSVSLITWVRAGQFGLSLLIMALLGLTAWAWQESRWIEEQAAQYEQAAERIQAQTQRVLAEAKRGGIDLSEKQLGTLAREVAFANQLLEKRAFSWTQFLSDLETAVPLTISISSVALNFKDSTITLNGAARTFKDLTSLVDSLEAHSAFESVVLSNYRVKQAKPGEPSTGGGDGETRAQSVDFTLSVTYRPEK